MLDNFIYCWGFSGLSISMSVCVQGVQYKYVPVARQWNWENWLIPHLATSDSFCGAPQTS